MFELSRDAREGGRSSSDIVWIVEGFVDGGSEESGTSPNSNLVSASMSPREWAYEEAEAKRESAALEMAVYSAGPRRDLAFKSELTR